MKPKETDSEEFGEKSWVYCRQHLGPHETGWCSVPASEKVRLDAANREDAYVECLLLGFTVAGT